MAKGESKELTVPVLLASDRGIGELRKAVPAGINPERLARVALTAWKNAAALQGCDPQSFMYSVMQAAQLGLEVNSPLDQASLIPFGKECKLIVEYKGLIHLAHRSPNVRKIDGHVVRRVDDFDFEYGSNEFLRHKPKIDGLPESWIDRDDMRAFWAGIKLAQGDYKFEVMAASEIWDHERRYVRNTGKDSPWKNSPARMGIKTVIRRLLKQVPLSVEVTEALDFDERIERGEPLSMGDAEIVLPSDSPIGDAQLEELKKLVTNGDKAEALDAWLGANGYAGLSIIPAARFEEAKGACK